MSILDDTKERLAATGDKIKEGWEDTKDRVEDKVDEMRSDAELKKAQVENDSVKSRNEYKESLRE